MAFASFTRPKLVLSARIMLGLCAAVTLVTVTLSSPVVSPTPSLHTAKPACKQAPSPWTNHRRECKNLRKVLRKLQKRGRPEPNPTMESLLEDVAKDKCLTTIDRQLSVYSELFQQLQDVFPSRDKSMRKRFSDVLEAIEYVKQDLRNLSGHEDLEDVKVPASLTQGYDEDKGRKVTAFLARHLLNKSLLVDTKFFRCTSSSRSRTRRRSRQQRRRDRLHKKGKGKKEKRREGRKARNERRRQRKRNQGARRGSEAKLAS